MSILIFIIGMLIATDKTIMAMAKKKRQKPTVIELFAGAGLLSYAFKTEGFKLLQAVEIERPATETYRQNLGNHVECVDVRKASPVSSCDVLVAGPPCQGFSTLGLRKADDPRNQLSFEVAKWAKKVSPEIVVVENVAAFLSTSHWQKLKRSFQRQGYKVQAMSLNAVDYGVPQMRRRSFTIASRVELPLIKSVVKRGSVTVRDAWKGLSEYPDGKNNHFAPEPSELALARMQIIPSGGDKRDIMQKAPELVPMSWWRMGGQATDVWGRMQWDQPSNTLRTCLLNPSKGRYIHPTQDRVISLREAARLHSIPDSWKFIGTPTQIARQIGNSVPPLLGRAVARAVMIALNRNI